MRDVSRTSITSSALIAVLSLTPVLDAQRAVEGFNQGWCFAEAEQGADVIQASFDDSSWDAMQLPHDWAIDGPFDPQGNGSTGKLPWRGIGWYRKTFSLEPFQEHDHSLFHGKAMLIVLPLIGNGGPIRVIATSDGLESATARLRGSQ